MSKITHMCLVWIGGESFFGNGYSISDAVNQCKLRIKDNLAAGGRLYSEINCTIYDYVPYTAIRWDGERVYGEVTDSDRIEVIQPIATCKLDGSEVVKL